MKIGFDIRTIGRQRTGDETYTKNLVRNFLTIDKANQYFFYTNVAKKEEIEKIKKEIDPIGSAKNYEIISLQPVSKIFWTFYSLPKYLRDNPVDILHVQYITPFFLPKGVKLVTTIHDVSFKVFPQHIKKLDLFFLNFLIPPSLKRADGVISVSHFAQKEIIKYYKISAEKIKVIYNGGADERFIQTAKFRNEERIKSIKEKYHLPDKFIFYLGSLQPRKNIPFLLKAFKEFKNEHVNREEIKNLKLVIGGRRGGHNYDIKIEEELEKIKNEAPEVFNEIIFTDYIENHELPLVYQSASVFCFPSLYEGFGLPLIEAMVMDLPVLCADSSCHQEVAGGGAIYFRGNDKKDFTNKLFNIIINKDIKINLVMEGRKRADFFSWEKTAQKTLEFYKDLIV